MQNEPRYIIGTRRMRMASIHNTFISKSVCKHDTRRKEKQGNINAEVVCDVCTKRQTYRDLLYGPMGMWYVHPRDNIVRC